MPTPNKKVQKVLSSDLKQNEYTYSSVLKRDARNKKIAAIVIFLVGAISIGASMMVEGNFKSQNEDLENEIRKVGLEKSKLKKEIEKVENAKKTIIQNLTKEVEKIENTAFYWSKVMNELDQLTGANIIISKLAGHYSEKDKKRDGANSMKLSGETTTYSSIATYIEGLEESPFFEDVEFKTASKSRRLGKPTSTSISLSFDLSDQAKINEENEKIIVSYKKSREDATSLAAPNAKQPPQPVWDKGKMAVTTAISPENGSFTLVWKNNKESLFSNVYIREFDPKNKEPLLDEENIATTVRRQSGLTTSYEHLVVDPLKEYEVGIEGISEVGVRSKLSEKVVVTGGIVRNLQPVVGVKMERSPRQPNTSRYNPDMFKEEVTVMWDQVADPDFYAYEVYIGTVKEDLNLVATIKEQRQTTFTGVFPYTKAENFARVVYVDKNGNRSN